MDRPTEVRPRFKAEPKKKKASKRARPGDPMADACEMCGLPRPAHRHHRLRRGQGGGDERENTIDICNACHDHVHANPEWSYLNGYLMRSST